MVKFKIKKNYTLRFHRMSRNWFQNEPNSKIFKLKVHTNQNKKFTKKIITTTKSK